MRTVTVTEEEAKLIVAVLRSNWIPVDLQKRIYDLIEKIEQELTS